MRADAGVGISFWGGGLSQPATRGGGDAGFDIDLVLIPGVGHREIGAVAGARRIEPFAGPAERIGLDKPANRGVGVYARDVADQSAVRGDVGGIVVRVECDEAGAVGEMGHELEARFARGMDSKKMRVRVSKDCGVAANFAVCG